MKSATPILACLLLGAGCNPDGAGCGESNRARVEALTSADASRRAEAVSNLCADNSGRHELVSALMSDVPLDVIVSAAGHPGCLANLPAGVAGKICKLSDKLVTVGLPPAVLPTFGERAVLNMLAAYRRSEDHAFQKRVDDWWLGLPEAKRATWLGKSAGFDLLARSEYNLGSAARVRLVPAWPAGLPGVGQMWLLTSNLTATVNGKRLPERRWRLGRRIEMTDPIDLDLATISGAATTAEGKYRLELRFGMQIFESAAKTDGESLFTGVTVAGPVSFEITRRLTGKIVQAVDFPDFDPPHAIGIRINALGKAITAYPPPSGRRQLSLDGANPEAELLLVASVKHQIGLAYDVVATGKDGKPHKIGWLASNMLDPDRTNKIAGRLNLKSVMPDAGTASMRLRLEPSAEVAYRDPEISSYCDKPLDLGQIVFSIE